jgi:hypothetical protein
MALGTLQPGSQQDLRGGLGSVAGSRFGGNSSQRICVRAAARCDQLANKLIERFVQQY